MDKLNYMRINNLTTSEFELVLYFHSGGIAQPFRRWDTTVGIITGLRVLADRLERLEMNVKNGNKCGVRIDDLLDKYHNINRSMSVLHDKARKIKDEIIAEVDIESRQNTPK